MSQQPANPYGIPQAGDLLGDHVVVGELGRGGMAVALEVRHRETGERRAVKLMLPRGASDEVEVRFLQEFQALSSLDHPNVLKVYEWGHWAERPYFVMELLAGQELGVVVEGWRELPPADRFRRAEAVLVQLAQALDYIHNQGLVHRDVTPSNIMVLPDQTVRLMDFGVVKAPGADLTAVGAMVGTVAYISPEQIDGADVDARADLYSLGAVLYLMLTGRRPFNARTLSGFLDKHRNRPARPPRELAPTVPAVLDAACVRLLAKDPADRFASAGHLLRVLQSGSAGAHVVPDAGWIPPLVGRARELAMLRESVARVDQDEPGPGGVLIIEGAPGMGRSRLAAEVGNLARAIGLGALHVQVGKAPERAYRAFAPLYAEAVDSGLRPADPTVDAALAGAHRPKDADVRWAVHEVFRDVLDRLGPRVVIIDDLELGDAGSHELASAVVRTVVEGNAPGVYVVFTRGKHVGEDTAGTPLVFAALEQVQRIELGPLGAAAVEDMVLGLVTDSAAVRELAKRLHFAGEGNPFYVREMMLALVATRVIQVRENGRGRLDLDLAQVRAMRLPVPGPVRTAIETQLERLGAPARAVAEVLALAETELGLELLAEVLAIEDGALMDAVDELVDGGLVAERNLGGAEQLSLAVNRLDDILVEQVDPDRAVHVHHGLGTALERMHRHRIPVVVAALARHFEAGGVPAKAFPYLVRAGAKELADGHIGAALVCFDRALALEPLARAFLTLDEADKRLAHTVLYRASALFHLGRWAEAADEARRADQLARDLGHDDLLSGTAVELGRQARRVPDLDEAEAQLERALKHARAVGDMRLQVEPLYEIGAVRWGRGDLEGARTAWTEARSISETIQDEQKMALSYTGLGLLALCDGRTAEARRQLTTAIEVCEEHGLLERAAIARINLVELYHLTGHFKKGMELADRTVNEAARVDHRFGMALGLRYRAMLLTDIGRLAEAEECAGEALRIHRELVNPEEELGSLVVLARISLADDELDVARARCRAAQVLMDEYDTEGFAPVVLAWLARLEAVAGNASQARDLLDQSQTASVGQWPAQHVRALLNQARVHELLGNAPVAFDLAEQALRVSDACAYRYYAMRARQLASRTGASDAAISRHRRVAEALASSLGANLLREDTQPFLDIQSRSLRPAGDGVPPTDDGGRLA